MTAPRHWLPRVLLVFGVAAMAAGTWVGIDPRATMLCILPVALLMLKCGGTD
jgi:hypothetical protein